MSWRETYDTVRKLDFGIYQDCIRKATAISHNHYIDHYCVNSIKDELSLSADIEHALMEVARRALVH